MSTIVEVTHQCHLSTPSDNHWTIPMNPGLSVAANLGPHVNAMIGTGCKCRPHINGHLATDEENTPLGSYKNTALGADPNQYKIVFKRPVAKQ